MNFRYAKSFSANRVTREMVADLDKETLVELGITAVGDQVRGKMGLFTCYHYHVDGVSTLGRITT